MKIGGGHFAPKLGGQFELESGGHFKLELGGQYHWNLQFFTETSFAILFIAKYCHFVSSNPFTLVFPVSNCCAKPLFLFLSFLIIFLQLSMALSKVERISAIFCCSGSGGIGIKIVFKSEAL